MVGHTCHTDALQRVFIVSLKMEVDVKSTERGLLTIWHTVFKTDSRLG